MIRRWSFHPKGRWFWGYDLYFQDSKSYLVFAGKIWVQTINTPYDEISPYMAFDGRTLFSVVTISTVLVALMSFTPHLMIKLKMEFSSQYGYSGQFIEDDVDFKLTNSRLSAMYASNRKTSVGIWYLFCLFQAGMYATIIKIQSGIFASVLNSNSGTLEGTLVESPSKEEFKNKNHLYESRINWHCLRSPLNLIKR